ncbi:hypothetical protein [Methanopyrus kandleri]|uniref:Uncharacterized protein n=1 Tax=Methanopyrus kandleri TaxID=2320 RepID=A0A832T7S5_9EURY|nr:hypothetical protein [Methanopyrus kandleri]HII70952.1 hypothetical protein [Methanopyrus kandleri]
MRVVATPYYARLLERLSLDVDVVDPNPEVLRRTKADILVVSWDLLDPGVEYRAEHVVPGSVASFSEALKTGLRVGVLSGSGVKDLVRFTVSVLKVWSEFAPLKGTVCSEKRFVKELCWDLGVKVSERGTPVKPDYEGGGLPSHGFEDPLEALKTRARYLANFFHGTR